MPPHYYLRCLGSPTLVGPAGEPIQFKTRKHLALLVYLALEREHAHRRERLADLLWPRGGEAEARHSVATAISMFRNRLGPRAVAADRDHVRLTLEGLELDLERLERGEVLGDDITPPLEIASFLDQFDIAEAPEFALWRDRQQARLFPAIREGLLLLIDRCRRTGNFRQIEILADRLLGIDHLSEDGIRAKMEARAFDGDRLSALKFFEQWSARLKEELGASPSAQVEGIALRLRRRGWERSTGNEIPTVPTDHWRGHRFVGRGREYRALYESWEKTCRSDPTNLLVLGDSGVGKTTLTDRLITAAGLEGAATIRVQCYELDREIPYATLAGLIRGLLERPGATGTRPEALANLSVCIPEIRQRFPDLPQPAFADGEGVRVQLAEGMHELLSAVREETPVILVVDDLHLADDVSIAVLHQVLRRTAAQPVMLVLTARPSELTRSPSARRIRESTGALGIRIVEVPPMTEDESRELLAVLLENSASLPNAAERHALLTAASGYPMVLELFVRDWMANGRNAMALTLGAMTPEPGHAASPEHHYKALIDRIIQELPADTRSVLNLAAILGNRLNDLEMYQLVDLTLASTMTGMTMLNDLRLLRDNGRELGFRNELIRSQAYMTIPSTLRRVLHNRVADQLIEGESDRSPTGLELAWHCFRGGREDEARSFLLRGAREAIEDGAACEAELALTSAMERLPALEKRKASLLLAESLRDQGRWQDVLHALSEGSTSDTPSGISAFALSMQAQLKLGALSEPDAKATLRRLLLDLRRADTTESRYQVLEAVGNYLAETQSRECGIETLECIRSLSIAERSRKEIAARAFTYAVAAHYSEQVHEQAAAESPLQEAIELYSTTSTGKGLISLLMAFGASRMAAGRYEEAIPIFERARVAATSLGSQTRISRAISNLMMAYSRLGLHSSVLELAQQGQVAARSSRDVTGVLVTTLAAWSAGATGREELSWQYVSDDEVLFRSEYPAWAIQSAHLYLSDVLYLLRSGKHAIKHARQGTSGAFDQPLSRSYCGLFARAVARLGEADREAESALVRIQGLAPFESADVIDQLEIAAAELQLQLSLGRPARAAKDRFNSSIGRLPANSSVWLGLVGLREALEYATRAPENKFLLESTL